MAASCCQLPATRPELWPDGAGCPSCGDEGRTVAPATVHSHVVPHVTSAVTAEQYRFCKTPPCDVVYYGPSAGDVLSMRDLATDVGCKRGSAVGTVCYCFGHTAAAIVADVREHGHSRIRDAVVDEVRRENCRCRTANPSGRCCLPDINTAIRSARRDHAIGKGRQ